MIYKLVAVVFALLTIGSNGDEADGNYSPFELWLTSSGAAGPIYSSPDFGHSIEKYVPRKVTRSKSSKDEDTEKEKDAVNTVYKASLFVVDDEDNELYSEKKTNTISEPDQSIDEISLDNESEFEGSEAKFVFYEPDRKEEDEASKPMKRFPRYAIPQLPRHKRSNIRSSLSDYMSDFSEEQKMHLNRNKEDPFKLEINTESPKLHFEDQPIKKSKALSKSKEKLKILNRKQYVKQQHNVISSLKLNEHKPYLKQPKTQTLPELQTGDKKKEQEQKVESNKSNNGDVDEEKLKKIQAILGKPADDSSDYSSYSSEDLGEDENKKDEVAKGITERPIEKLGKKKRTKKPYFKKPRRGKMAKYLYEAKKKLL